MSQIFLILRGTIAYSVVPSQERRPMTPHKRVRRQRAEAFGQLFHEYAAGLGQFVRRTLRPTINLGIQQEARRRQRESLAGS